jgi:mannosyltransferase
MGKQGEEAIHEAGTPRRASVAPVERGHRERGGVPLWTGGASSQDEPFPWKLLALLTALAVTLRSIGLDSGLWYDEIRTLMDSVRSPLARIVTFYPGEHQHTLYSVLAHLSIVAFGEHEWSIRLPSMVIGAATVPLLYVFARELVEKTEALLAALLLAVSYHHIWFSQNARGYAILAFLTLLSSWLLVRGLRRGKPIDFIGYAIAAALGAYTHVTMVFVVASHALLCALPLGVPGLNKGAVERWRLPALGFALAGALTLLLYAPMLVEMQRVVEQRPSPVRRATTGWALGEALRGLRIGLGSVVGLAVAASFFVAGLWSYLKQSRFLPGLFLLPGIVTVSAAVALHRPVRPRFLVFLAGFGMLIVVRGALEIGRLVGRRASAGAGRSQTFGIALALVIVLVSAASLGTNYRYPKQDFAGAMRFVETRRAPDEPVVTAGPATYPYRAYFNRPWEGVTTLGQLEAIRARGRRVWVLYTLASYIENDAPDLMRALRSECVVAGVFRGTVGNGDVTVCETPPRASQ